MSSIYHHLEHHNDIRLQVRTFESGEREVLVQRTDTWLNQETKVRVAPRVKTEEEKVAAAIDNQGRAARRACATVRLRVKAIQADRMLTLTYRENMQDRERLARDWDAFRRRLRKIQGFEYVATVERQARGAYHMHVAVSGRQNYRVLRAVWLSVVGEGGGNIDVRNPFKERALRHKLAGYLSKYVSKAYDQGEKDERRVWASRGIEIPEKVTTWFRDVEVSEVLGVAGQYLQTDGELVYWHSRKSETFFFAVTYRC